MIVEIITVMMGICILAMGVILILTFRNGKVLEYRLDLISRDIDAYNKAPTYNEMLYHYKPLKDEYWIK